MWIADEKLSQNVGHFVASPVNLGSVSFSSFALFVPFAPFWAGKDPCGLAGGNVTVSSTSFASFLGDDKHEVINKIVSCNDALNSQRYRISFSIASVCNNSAISWSSDAISFWCFSRLIFCDFSFSRTLSTSPLLSNYLLYIVHKFRNVNSEPSALQNFLFDIRHGEGHKTSALLSLLSLPRLQAVPFWIVERSREIAEREKKKKLERTSGRGLGERQKKGERKRKGLRSWL